ncbi:hypothetical protein [Yersinia enterocolitica]|uniref:hypothetical protein n=1 Tax=Yersinia enterocolitica TaxID=630 RepID=UPI003D06C669
MNKISILNVVRSSLRYLNHPATTFSIGAVVVMLLDVYVTKGIDSSFVSACMDVVMATTAVLVFIEAKKYLQKSLSQDGYKVAIELQSQLLPKTIGKNVFGYNGSNLAFLFTHFDFRNKQIRPDLVERIKINSERNSNDLTKLCDLYDSIDEKKRLLSICGWDSSKEKRDELDVLLQNYEGMIRYLRQFKIIYDEILLRSDPEYIEVVYEKGEVRASTYLYECYNNKEFIDKVKSISVEYFKLHQDFINSYDAYFSSDSKIITTYFDEILKK